MALHETLSAKVNIDIFFCDPHSPWQRGSNENANGLVREFLSKGVDMSQVSHQKLTAIEHMLNHRPHKILNYHSPHKVFSTLTAQYIAGVAFQAWNRPVHHNQLRSLWQAIFNATPEQVTGVVVDHDNRHIHFRYIRCA